MPSSKIKIDRPKSCKMSDMQNPSKTHKDLDAFPTLPQGEVSKLTKRSNNTPKTDARDHFLGQRLQRQAKKLLGPPNIDDGPSPSSTRIKDL